ncbi:MAG: hypothetical protein ABI200_03915 [Gaiellales bacterium]
MRNRTRYAAIGYVVSKFVIPVAKQQAKKQAKNKVRGAAVGTRDAVVSHPARTSIAVGALVGAAGWLLTRNRSTSHEER